jgi:hypothetical protein
MALILRRAAPVEGLHWVRAAFAQYFRRPLGFTAMFVSFLVVVLLATVLPLAGPVLMLMSLPLLGLGFMIATRAAGAGEPVHPGQFLEPLRAAPARRNPLLWLCALYALGTALIMLLADWVDGGTFEQLQVVMAKGDAAQAEVEALLADPRLARGLLTRFGLAALLSVPFWQAPPLVYWQGQGVAQALFSSTLALWRCKGAFAVYALAWLGVVLAFAAVAAMLFGLIGARQLAGAAAMPAALVFSTAFYVSLLFTYEGCFSDAPSTRPPDSDAALP